MPFRPLLRTIAAMALAATAIVALAAAPVAAGTDPDDVLVGSGDDTRSVERLYRAYFLRAPDADGLAHWERVRASGTSLISISDSFARSDEFADRYGSLGNRDFVALVYRNVLDRAPDSRGHAYWTGLLDRGAPRGLVMLGFSDSEEFKRSTLLIGTGADTRSVERLYRAYFLRAPDPDGLAYWNDVRDRGASLTSISDSFARSDEFADRYGSLGNRDFVALVYRNVLDRYPDSGGHAYWTGLLDRDAPRGLVMLGFSDSEEFKRTALAPRKVAVASVEDVACAASAATRQNTLTYTLVLSNGGRADRTFTSSGEGDWYISSDATYGSHRIVEFSVQYTPVGDGVAATAQCA